MFHDFCRLLTLKNNSLDPDQAPNCLQSSSADDKIRGWSARSSEKNEVY